MANKPGLWAKLVDYLGFGPEEEEWQEEEEVAAESAAAEEEWPADIKRSTERKNVVPITAVPPKQAPFKVLVVEPRSFEEVQTIVDQMRARRPIILNLESLDKDLAQKILNFLNGAIYALGGETQRVAQGIFFFAPQGVDISTMGRGLTGQAIGGGSVDLPTEVLERLTGAAERESILGPVESKPFIAGERPAFDPGLLARATGRDQKTERNLNRFDWRN
jgi:cell division inhibitor SepF